ncbi:MAG: hypothetical protein WKG32_20205 [Gemmatimonadaceae bacterium]
MRTPHHRDRSPSDETGADPGREADEARATANIASRLRDRDIKISGRDDGEELTDLLTAVEEFESAVARHGGDNMVNTLASVDPQDAAFVLPVRNADESVRAYTTRVRARTDALR